MFKKVIIFLALVLVSSMILGVPGAAIASDEANQEPADVQEIDNINNDVLPPDGIGLGGAIYAKYEGIDGESMDYNHEAWIDVRSLEWGASIPGNGGLTSLSRRRTSPVFEDLVITINYEKSVPKLQEKCLKGAVIPKLEIELTNTFGETPSTYLKYEFKNVLITSFHDSAIADGGPPTVTIGNNFEELKVTYTEYDDQGNSQGNVEYQWKIE